MVKRKMRFMWNYTTGLVIIIFLALFAGVSCTGEPETDLVKGKFAAGGSVEGLEYKSGHKEGRTGVDGDFYYNPDDLVSFFVGGVKIGRSATAAIVMSPINLADDDASYVMHPAVLNMARLFQTLDLDGNLDNGITLSDEIKNEFKGLQIPFDISSTEFDAHSAVQELLSRLNARNIFPGTRELTAVDEAKRNLISNLLENNVRLPSVLINLGDEWAAGAQSGSENVTELTQSFGYAQVLSDSLGNALDLTWYNPLLDPANPQTRLDSTLKPYNLGVPGATVATLQNEKTGTGNTLLDKLFEPLGEPVTQLDAAVNLAAEHQKKLKFITLGIGNNDVLGAIGVDYGTRLSADAIDAFLYGPGSEHHLISVTAGLTAIVEELADIPDSYIFVANIPDVTDMAAILSNSDIETLAVDGASVSALADGDYLGFEAFSNLTTALMNSSSLNDTILTVTAEEGNVLHSDEVEALNSRVAVINTHINALCEQYDNVWIVDIKEFFSEVAAGDIFITKGAETAPLTMTLGGGFFSLDGMNPSRTGYALIANQFIKAMNGSGLKMNAFENNYLTVWGSDPYRDMDGDGFVKGPETEDTIDETYRDFIDCDDGDDEVIAPRFSGEKCFEINPG